MPIRLKGIYLLHQPPWINFMVAMVRPFMKKKLLDRIR